MKPPTTDVQVLEDLAALVEREGYQKLKQGDHRLGIMSRAALKQGKEK